MDPMGTYISGLVFFKMNETNSTIIGAYKPQLLPSYKATHRGCNLITLLMTESGAHLVWYIYLHEF